MGGAEKGVWEAAFTLVRLHHLSSIRANPCESVQSELFVFLV